MNKRIIPPLIRLLFLLPFFGTAQVGVWEPSAALQVSSTTQGFLPPRMSTHLRQQLCDKTKIPAKIPAIGLLIYNTSTHHLEVHVGDCEWVKLGDTSTATTIFFDSDNDTGIEVEKNNPSEDVLRLYTNTPDHGQERMTINASGTVHIKGALADSSGASGTLGQVLSSTGTQTQWVDAIIDRIFDGDGSGDAYKTGIAVEETRDEDVIHFYTNGQERMTISASGTVHIKGALEDSAGASGTLGQVLSSTVTGTQWKDSSPSLQFTTTASLNGLDFLSTVVSGTMVVNTDSRTLHVRNATNTGWNHYDPAVIYHRGPFDSTPLKYETIVSRATGQVWLDRNIGADSRTSASTYKTTTWNDSYGHYFSWYDIMIQADGSTDGKYRMGGSNPICPFGFRLPTEDEWEAEFPPLNASSSCLENAFNHLFLPTTGYNFSGSAAANDRNHGAYGHYWSSFASGGNGQNLSFSSSNAGMNTARKSYGFSLRCLKD